MLKRFAFIAALVGITCCGSTTSDGPDSPDTPTTPTNPTTPTAVVGDVSINVMTFNIRYDNTGDGQNIWANRRDRAANAIKFYRPRPSSALKDDFSTTSSKTSSLVCPNTVLSV